VPALFTFGLSIPAFALVGSGAGFCVGAAVGSSTGVVTGGAIGYGIHGKRTEISDGVQRLLTFTKTKFGVLQASVEIKTQSAGNMLIEQVPAHDSTLSAGAAPARAPAQNLVSVIHDGLSETNQESEPRTPSRSGAVKHHVQQLTPQKPPIKYANVFRVAPDAQTKIAAPQTISVNGFTKTSSVWVGA